jgi:CRP-like cAMP-binding protein
MASSYLDHLSRIPLFSACSKRELERIGSATDEIDVDAGRVLVKEGAVGHEAFVIVEGTAEVRRGEQTVAELGPGDHFGELAILDGGPRTASVVAASPLKVLVLGQREFSALVDDVPGLSHKLLRALAGRVRELDRKIYP